MAAKTVMQAMRTLVLPTDIPAANVDLWFPASFQTFPHCVLSLAQASDERYKGARLKNERHFIQISYFQQAQLVGTLQAAQDLIYTWIETTKANIRANFQLATANVPACHMCGQTSDGQGMLSYVDMALDERVSEPLAHGWLVVPVEDLFTSV